MISTLFAKEKSDYRQFYTSITPKEMKKILAIPKKVQHICLWIFAALFSIPIHLEAQTLPITITTQTLPPHTGNLDELVAPGTNKINLTMILRDVNELSYQVQLRMVLEGQGIRLSTRPHALINPITLSYGTPTQLVGADLAEYFDPLNLNFEGISRETYLKEGGLPDGFYTICFTALDYDRFDTGEASLPACATIRAVRNDPPVLLAPIGEQVLFSPQNLTVQWQPRHTGFPTRYTVQIYEYDPTSGLRADRVMDFTQPYVEKSVQSLTSLFIDATDPQLEWGKTYIARVGAEDMTMTQTFSNDGWSEIQLFTYGTACLFPENIAANVLDHERAQISWQAKAGFNNYVVRYREKGRPDANWYEEESPLLQVTLSGLTDSTTYEYQVQTLCGGDQAGEFSPIDEFTTLSPEFNEEDLECGSVADLTLPTNTTPITDLQFGNIVSIGSFNMTLASVAPSSANPNAWKGTGLIRIPWLGKKIMCEFTELSVNTEKQVFAGEVTAFSEGLESIENFKSPAEIQAEMDTANVDFCGNPVAAAEESPEEAETESEEEADEGLAASMIGVMNNMGGVPLPALMGDRPNMIVLDGMTFTPEGGTLDAFMSVEMPEAGRYLAFKLLDAPFHGGGLSGEPRLELASDISIELGTNKMLLTLKAGEETFVSWDCKGLQSISIAGEVKFCRDMIVPVDPTSFERLEGDNFVTGSFTTVMPEWGQFTADISMTPFEIPKLEDWVWSVESAVFDFSDKMTPPSVVFPENYVHPDLEEEGNSALWKGFFLSEVRIKIPDKFSRPDSEPIQLGAKNIIIDKTGFTGDVFILNALSLEDGRIDTWAFAIDSLELGIQSNQFHHTAFAGRLEVPAFKEPLGYECLIQPESEYAFSVTLNDSLEMQAWRAKVALFPDSEIGIAFQEEEDAFIATAKLNGMASFAPSVGKDTSATAKDKLNIPEVRFQDFQLISRAPFIEDIGLWQLSSENGDQSDLSNFPLTINEISMSQEDTEISLVINAEVNLVPADDNGFAAGGEIRIISEIVEDPANHKQKWSFKRVAVNELGLDVSGPGYAFEGKILFYENVPRFGSGFRGEVRATFEPKIEVGAVIQFGEVNDFRYWFADALVAFDPGIALGQSGLALYGFGGGASYHMRREGFNNVTLPAAGSQGETGEEGDTESAEGELAAPEDIGKSLSNTTYIPDRTAGLGIKAMVALGTVRPEVFNGSLTFEIIFNTSGSIKTIGFQGDAQFMTPPEVPGQPAPDPALRCQLDMLYDFENKSFHAQLDLFVNYNEGLIHGAYPENLAGTGVIHADENDWYIHLGTPQKRIMLSMDISGLANLKPGKKKRSRSSASDGAAADRSIDFDNVGLLLTAYLDAGTQLPPFPDIPDRVKSILNSDDFNMVARDDPRFRTGNGIMFGASMELSMPDLEFLVFYASFEAGAGFDVMLVDLGETARCAGNENSGEPVGINGWYATGQVYAYLEGSVGIKVDAFGVSGKFDILEIGAAAVLQARLPNPLWMKGTVGGYYNILGGLVSGRCSFQFEVGEQCQIVGASQVAGINLVGSTNPNGNTSQNVDVFVRPQATFNIPIGHIFKLQDDNGNTNEFRAVFGEFTLTNQQSNQPIAGTIDWSDNRDVVAFTPSEILAGNTPHQMRLVMQFETKPQGSSTWRQLLGSGGQAEEEIVVVDFTTGAAPDYIPHHNVAFSYPIIDQFNFLRNESGNGFIQLKQGQAYLFKDQASFALEANEWDQKVIFTQGGQEVGESSLSYNAATRSVNFAIPGNNLQTNTISQIIFRNIPLVQTQNTDVDVEELENELFNNQTSADDTAFTSIVVRDRVAQGTLRDLKENEFYGAHFRTSVHNTFQEKINAMDMNDNWFDPMFLDPSGGSQLTIDDFGVFVKGREPFDLFEQDGYYNGHDQIKPLIRLEADLRVTGQNWFNEHIFPFMYQHLPQRPEIELDWRNPRELGDVPTQAVFLRQSIDPVKLEESDKSNGRFSIPNPTTNLVYHLPFTMYRDYFEYKNDVGNFATRNANMSPALSNFLKGHFILPLSGNYRVIMKYVLPGEDAGSSTRVVSINIPYGINN